MQDQSYRVSAAFANTDISMSSAFWIGAQPVLSEVIMAFYVAEITKSLSC